MIIDLERLHKLGITTHAYFIVNVENFPTSKQIVDPSNGISHTYDIHDIGWETSRWEGGSRDIIVLYCTESGKEIRMMSKLFLPWKKCIKTPENIAWVESFREKFLS